MISIMEKLLKAFPFTIVGLLTAGMFLGQLLLKLEYDDGGLGSILFIGSYILGALFHGAADLIYAVAGAKWLPLPLHAVASVVLGLVPYGIADALLARKRQN